MGAKAMKLLEFSRPSLKDALEAADGLRRDLESGKIAAFVAVGVADDDATFAYLGATKPVSNLRMIGAQAHALLSLYQQ
jgi:hypothetical protein